MADPLLVTGLSGLLGQKFQSLFADRYSFQNLDLTTGVDITDSVQVERAIRDSSAKSILHLAAFTNVSSAHDQTGDKSGLCYRVNVVGTQNIVQAASKHNKFFVHVSTDFVFSGSKDDPYSETDIPDPIEWYGQTKYEAEKIVTQHLPQSVIIRLSYPYQANPARPDWLAGMIQKLKDNSLPPAFADHTITPTFADDICQVFDYSLTHHPSGVYHAVGSSWHTDYQIAQMVKKIFDLPGEVKKGSLKEYLKTTNRPYQMTLKTSNQKLSSEFDLKMKSLEEGLNQIRLSLN